MSQDAQTTNRMTRATLIAAIGAAFAASACCLGPAILAIVGVSGVGFAAALEPYRPLMLVATAGLLGVGFYVSYRKPRMVSVSAAVGGAAPDSADACGCAMPRASRAGRRMLWAATLVATVFAAYPYIASAFSHDSSTGTASATGSSAVVQMHVEGMTCRACTSHISDELAQLPGVVRAEVDYDGARATVTYDPTRVQPQALVDAVGRTGYPARVESTR